MKYVTDSATGCIKLVTPLDSTVELLGNTPWETVGSYEWHTCRCANKPVHRMLQVFLKDVSLMCNCRLAQKGSPMGQRAQ